MSNHVKSLHDQNSRLRNEIKRLRNSIRDLSNSARQDSDCKNKESNLTKSQKENILNDLKNQITQAKNPNKASNWKKLPPTWKPSSSSNNSEQVSVRAGKEVQENLKKIEKLSGFGNSGKFKISENCKNVDLHSRLIDSFQSYYESEEENLNKFGKCELSYAEYKKDHEKGSRRKEKVMAEEIEMLRKENSNLKEKLQKVVRGKIGKTADVGKITKIKDVINTKSIRSFPHQGIILKTAYSVTPRPRSSSRLSGKSFRTSSSFLSSRRKHCRKCTALLAKGFSTVHCTKHNPLKAIKN